MYVYTHTNDKQQKEKTYRLKIISNFETIQIEL